MIDLTTVRASNAALVQSQPLVVVVVGGTSGIGECAVRSLAATHAKHKGKGLRVYIVGRNQTAAEKIIGDCLQLCPTEKFRFVQVGNLALLKEVDKACAEIVAEEKKIEGSGLLKVDLLIETQGYVSTDFTRHETEEGLDDSMGLLYYGRMRFIHQLLPLLTTSPIGGRVISVSNPRAEGKVLPEDPGLRQPGHYNFSYSFSHKAMMMRFFHERVAAEHPGKIALSHYYPGYVRTNIAQGAKASGFLKGLWKYLIDPLLGPFFAVPHDECGQRILFHASSRYPAMAEGKVADVKVKRDGLEVAMASNGKVGGGSYRTTWNGDIVPSKNAYDVAKECGFDEITWEHTMRVFEVIESGKVFME